MNYLRKAFCFVLIITVIAVFNYNSIFAKPSVDKKPYPISFLAYSEFANEYSYNGKILKSGIAWFNPDDTIALYESGRLYQFDDNLDLMSNIEIKDMNVEEDTQKTDTTKIIKSDKNLKIITVPSLNKTYYLIKKEYKTKKEDLEKITTSLNEIKEEEKGYYFRLQTLATSEQKERNKLSAMKAKLSSQEYNNRINGIKLEFVEERNEIEKKMMEIFRKKSKLNYDKTLAENRKNIVEIKLINNSKNIEEKEFIAPDNFWGISLFDLQNIVTDDQGIFYGYRKEDKRIYVFDYTGEILLSFAIDNQPEKIYIDKNKIIYVVTSNYVAQYKSIGFAPNFLTPTSNNLDVIGSIMGEATWSGKVFISGETRIEKNAILYIKPGTEVIFTKGITPKLNIYGTIKAVGTKDNYIKITTNTPYPLGEINIYADDTQETSLISFVRFEKLQFAVRIYDSSPEIIHSIFINNEDAVWYNGTSPDFFTKCSIKKNTIKDNLVGILVTFLTNGVNPTIQYNNIYNNKRGNLSYKNREDFELSYNYWGMSEVDKILKTIAVESKKDEEIKISLDPILPVPFDITNEN